MPPPHPCWLALFLTRREVYSLRRLAGPASSDDWRCSYLCSELIPPVTDKSALFVTELSFPLTAPTDDPFFNRTGLERAGVVGPEFGLLLGWYAGSSVALLCKNKNVEGLAGASPVAALMPKSVPS